MQVASFATALLAAALPVFASTVPNIRIPVVFETEADHFVSRSTGRTLTVKSDSAVIGYGTGFVTMRLAGASSSAKAERLDPRQSVSNYLIGNVSAAWRTGNPHYGAIKYKGVYPGIDAVYHGAAGQLEYDFVVSPGADPSLIALSYEGVNKVSLDGQGDLLIDAGGTSIRQHRPFAYQLTNGRRHPIEAEYKVHRARVQISLGDYDRTRELIIDPVLQYAAYFGHTGYDAGVAIASGASGTTYVAGVTTSVQLPTTNASGQRDNGGASDAFVAKFTASGDLAWVTYYGGKGSEGGLGVAVDAAGNSFLSGFTTSQTLPLRNAAQDTFGGGELDAFVAKFSPGGDRLLFATYVGGSGDDYGNGLALDDLGNAYLTGWTRSADFPVRGGFQQGASGGGGDTFVMKLSPGGQVVYSTFVGGNGDDLATGIAVDVGGNAYVTGFTTSIAFPLAGAIQRANAGKYDVFVYKLNAAGNSLVYSTFLGGAADDRAQGIAVDSSGSAYISGDTQSANFPVLAGAQMTPGGGTDGFVAKLTPGGDALVYSTLLGGSGEDYASGLAVDAAGTVYVCGWTNSADFPVRNALQSSYGGGLNDGFAARIAPAGNLLLYATYFGGGAEDKAYDLVVESSGALTLTGHTDSANLPGAVNSFSVGLKTADVFLAKFSPDTGTPIVSANPGALVLNARFNQPPPPSIVLNIASTGQPATFTASSSAPWLRVTPAGGFTGTALTVSIEQADLAPGVYREEIAINTTGTVNPSLRIPVSLNVTVDPPVVAAAGILNAASFSFGPLAPGEMFTVFGSNFGPPAGITGELTNDSLPNVIADTRILVDNLPVPLLNAAHGQVTAIMPYSVAGRASVTVQVETGGRRSDPQALGIAPASPGIFTANASGGGQAAALNENGSANSSGNPAAPGSIVVLYATGEGLLNPSAVEGKPIAKASPVNPVTVRFADTVADVLYAGTIPGGIPGILQLNVRVPLTAAAGAVPVVLSIAGAISPTVTVAIR